MNRTARRMLLRSAGIVVASLAVSAGYAFVRGIPWRPDLEAIAAKAQHRAVLHAEVGITLDEFRELVGSGAIVVDVRSADAFEEEHLAAPETVVLNVPASELDEHIPRLMALLGEELVLHCSSVDCDDAEEVYEQLVGFGFEPARLHVLVPGWKGLVEAGWEAVSGPEF